MKVHLIRSEGFPIEDFNNVLNLLRLARGPVEFVPSTPIILPEADQDITYPTMEDFIKKDEHAMFSLNSQPEPKLSLREMIFPRRERTLTWAQLFKVCKDFRRKNRISDQDHVVLLTQTPNDKNWFGAVDASMRNYFIQTNDWHLYFEKSVDIRFPIAYEVTVWLMRTLIYSNQLEILEHVHREPVGCMMDFCLDKRQIVLKMRTADICPTCTDYISSVEPKHNYLKQFFDTMDGIRENLLFRKRSVLMMQPSKIEIRGYRKDIFLTDLGDLQVNLNPKEKALFLLYLNHPEGIQLSHLIDHRNELRNYYSMLSTASSIDQINANVDRLVDFTDNNINEVLTRIRRKFKDSIDKLGKLYSIEHVGGCHKITLNRELVTFKD